MYDMLDSRFLRIGDLIQVKTDGWCVFVSSEDDWDASEYQLPKDSSMILVDIKPELPDENGKKTYYIFLWNGMLVNLHNREIDQMIGTNHGQA